MRTLTVHTADELAVRWKRMALKLTAEAESTEVAGAGVAIRAAAEAYRVCAVELQALAAVTMELEAAHHGDPEMETETVSP